VSNRCAVCVELLGDVGHVKSSWMHLIEHLGEWIMWNLVSVHLETMLVSMQYRCMVFAERTIGPEIILDAPDDTPRSRGSSEACLSLFGDSGNLDAR
jgi:hypothetical protein